MLKPISSTVLRNRIKKIRNDLEFKLHNENINGTLHGCSGFVIDPVHDHVVYVSTDLNHHTNTQAMYRTARDAKDYRGGRNRFTSYDPDVLAQDIIDLLDDMAAGNVVHARV